MPSTRAIRAGLAIFAITSALVAGCTNAAPTALTSAWPQAVSERAFPKPAELSRWPLTGLPAEGGSTTVRAVAVKIENSPESRPQSALDQADVVYESLTEGGITRFNAIFHSQAPETVGPVRSARLSDTYIVPQYNALFAHVGGNSGVISKLRSLPVDDLDQFYSPGPYWRSSSRAAPHNMYTSIPALRELGKEKGFEAEHGIPPFAFQFLPEDLEPSIVSVSIPFAPGNTARWDYDSERDVYLRSINGRVHEDAISGEQYSARNVVVLWARTSVAGARDAVGSTTLDIELTGNGRCSVFRNGQRFDGTWTTDGSRPPVFADESGEPIRMAPGNTWMQVVTTTTNISME